MLTTFALTQGYTSIMFSSTVFVRTYTQCTIHICENIDTYKSLLYKIMILYASKSFMLKGLSILVKCSNVETS